MASEKQARELGIPLATWRAGSLDITIDGADEVDATWTWSRDGRALLREKIVAYSTRMEVIVVDDSKIVSKLGPSSRCRWRWFRSRTDDETFMEELGCRAELRGGDVPFITDNAITSTPAFRARDQGPVELQKRLKISREWWRPACS